MERDSDRRNWENNLCCLLLGVEGASHLRDSPVPPYPLSPPVDTLMLCDSISGEM